MKKKVLLVLLSSLLFAGCNDQAKPDLVLSASSISVNVGETYQVTAEVTPSDLADKTVTWSISEGSEYAVVDSNGLVTGLKEGNAVLTASSNNVSKTCSITVLGGSHDILPESISIDSSATISLGGTKQLTAVVLPENATDKSVTWSVVSGLDCVSVSAAGLVSGVKVGNGVVKATTSNGLTSTCNVTVSSEEVLPTDVTLNSTSTEIKVGGKATLVATVAPSYATNKSLTWSVIEGEDCVSVSGGVVTATKVGTAKVQVSTVNGKTAVCDVTVSERTIKAYINDDRHGLISDDPYQKVGDGDFVKVTSKVVEQGITIYDFIYGATVRFNLAQEGYFKPTGLKVNEDVYDIDDNQVTFVATVEDPDDEYMNFLDIVVKFEDLTPMEGDYAIECSDSAHISLKFKYDVNGQETKACSHGDKIIVTPVTDSDYEVKTITGYTYTTNDSIQHKSYFDITKVGDGTYYFITPFSHEDIKTIWIEFTEVNSSLFKDSDLVGDYAVVRTYGLSESSSYLDKFESEVVMSFASSGEIDYKSEIAYASGASNGVINAMFTTSNINLYYGKNLIVAGQSSSGSSMITPFSQSSTDLAIGVKVAPGMLLKDIVIDNFVTVIDGHIYGVFSFYYNDSLYASFYADVATGKIVTDVTINKYAGSLLWDDQSVFEVFDKEDNSLAHFGYVNDGGKGSRCFISDLHNGYHNDTHSLVFINDETAIYDSYKCKVSVDGNNVTLNAPIRHVELTLNPTDLTFMVNVDEEVVPKTLDIAGKVFTGKDGSGNNMRVEFGPSNDSITGRVIEEDGCGYFWDFTATFDSTNNELVIQVVNNGYFYLYRPEVTYKYGDDGAYKSTKRIAIDDGKITFIDNVSGMTSYWITKGCTVTCSDFHF